MSICMSYASCLKDYMTPQNFHSLCAVCANCELMFIYMVILYNRGYIFSFYDFCQSL